MARNGKTKAGKQKLRCRACGCYGTLAPHYGYSEERKSEILRAYHERSCLRGLERTFGVARQTVAAWLKNARDLQPLETTLVPVQPEDVLGLALSPHPVGRVLVRGRPKRGQLPPALGASPKPNAVDLSKTLLISVVRVLCQWSTEMNTPVIHSFYSELIKTVTGIQQELFAIHIVCVIARVVTARSVSSEALETEHCNQAPQLKNAAKAFAREAAILTGMSPDRAFSIFQELLDDIRRGKYYQRHEPKPSTPRINKASANKWQGRRSQKITAA